MKKTKTIGQLKKGDIFKFNDSPQMVHKKYRNDDSPLVTFGGVDYHNEDLEVEVLPLIMGNVYMNDPESEDEDLKSTVNVILDNGAKFSFFVTTFSELEYLRRSSLMYYIENKQ